MARDALLAGKHVFVEKPMARTSEQCRELMEIAEERSLVLMPGHTFLSSPPVRKFKSLLDAEELGEVYFGTFSERCGGTERLGNLLAAILQLKLRRLESDQIRQ
jgi:predicted dehydrogenase